MCAGTAPLASHPPQHSCCTFSTGKFLLLPHTLQWNILLSYTLHRNILAVTLYLPLEHSCCTFSTGTFLLFSYTLHWNILAVTLYPPLEHSSCYPIHSTGIFLLLPYTLPPLEHSRCYCTPAFVPVKAESTSSSHFRNSITRPFFSLSKLQGNNNFELLLLTRKINVLQLIEDLPSRP